MVKIFLIFVVRYFLNIMLVMKTNLNQLMKKNNFASLLLFVICAFPIKIYGQCNPLIPANAAVVNNSQLVNGGFTPQWVCSGDSLTSNGGSFTVFLEPGAVMNTGGGIDSIYVKAGATLNMNGGIHYIIYEPMAVLHILGGIPYYDTCVGIHYDYSHAPAGGCLETSVSSLHLPDVSFNVSPNPFSASPVITFSNEQKNTVITITDLIGNEIRTIHFSGQKLVIDKSELSEGIYFLKVIDEKNNVVNKKIVVQ